jgi:polyisoprenoid-binding protein YceI
MHRKLLYLSFPLALAACGNHTEGVAPATVSSAPAAPAQPAQPAPAARETLALDRARSTVGFTGAKVTGSHDGTFGEFDGTIELDPRDLSASSVRVEIRTASVRIEPERLAQHLRAPDFFDVDRFPTATFASTAVREGGEGTIEGRPATHTITGTLTLRGETRTISFPAIVEVGESEVRARSEFTIRRREFGIVYPGMPDDLIRDEVVIRFDVRAPRRG